MSPHFKVLSFLVGCVCLPLTAPADENDDDAASLISPEEEAEFAELQALFEGDDESADQPAVPPAEAEPLSAWIWFADLSVGAGYDDNVLLSDVPAGSGFVSPEAQIYGAWVSTNRLRASILGYYQGRYFERARIDDEQLAFFNLAGEWRPPTWRVRTALDFIHSRQVYDATELVTAARESGVITLSRPKWTVSARRSGKGSGYTEAEVFVGRSLFREIDEDYWAYGLEITRGHSWGFLDLELFAGLEREQYVESVSRNARGYRLKDRLLIDRLLAGGDLEWTFGKGEAWELSLDLWGTFDEEQDGTYYDRWRVDASPGIAWESGGWTLFAEAGYQYTDYRTRYATFLEPAAQWQQKWSGSGGAAYEWDREWRAELILEYADLQSNRSTIRYVRRAVTTALTYSF